MFYFESRVFRAHFRLIYLYISFVFQFHFLMEVGCSDFVFIYSLGTVINKNVEFYSLKIHYNGATCHFEHTLFVNGP